MQKQKRNWFILGIIGGVFSSYGAFIINDGLTPLHLAAMKAKDVKLLQLLISKGADKKILTDFNESAFDLAKENELLSKSDITFLKQS